MTRPQLPDNAFFRAPAIRIVCRRWCIRLAPLRLAVCLTMVCAVSQLMAATLELGEYQQRADAARQRGDWQSVASQLAQAINHPDLLAGEKQRSAIYLDYGRAVGVFCQYDESEKYLRLAREIAQANAVSTLEAVVEMATMQAARGNYAQAIAELEPLVQTMQATNASAMSPATRALIHQQLALWLDVQGRSDAAEVHLDKAKELHMPAANGSQDAGRRTTPYGSQCR